MACDGALRSGVETPETDVVDAGGQALTAGHNWGTGAGSPGFPAHGPRVGPSPAPIRPRAAPPQPGPGSRSPTPKPDGREGPGLVAGPGVIRRDAKTGARAKNRGSSGRGAAHFGAWPGLTSAGGSHRRPAPARRLPDVGFSAARVSREHTRDNESRLRDRDIREEMGQWGADGARRGSPARRTSPHGAVRTPTFVGPGAAGTGAASAPSLSPAV